MPQPIQAQIVDTGTNPTQKTQNRLSGKSFRLCHIHDHPVHAEHKAAVSRFKDVMQVTRNQDWTDWLELISQQDLYIATKYITSEPSNYSNTRIPTLHTVTNNCPSTAEDNDSKAAALADSFFPPPPVTHVPPGHKYPPPLKGIRCFSWSRICQVICSLSLYKAPGPDKIPNTVLINCCDALIDHLYFIFRAVFDLNTYHPRLLESIMLMLCKVGKTSYDVAKSY